MKKLIVSIVTWNSESTISACIESVLRQSFRDFELIIVDNDSKDQTCRVVESFHDSRIKLIRKTENTGFCGGHNFSISNSESDFVLLVNPDIILMPDYVQRALVTIQKNDRTGTVCGLLLQQDPADAGSLIDSAGLDIMRSRVMRMRYHGKKRSECNLVEEEVFGADGALPLYRRTMINDISYQGQFFDEMFFAHKEDWDVSWRSHIYGWKTVFDPSCIAMHPRQFKPKSLKVRSSMAGHVKIHAVKNQLILLLKNESLSSFLLNGFFIVPRQIIILFYLIFFERASLKAYSFVLSNMRTIMVKRELIQNRKTQ